MKSRSFGSVISAIVLGLSSVSTLSAMEFNEVGHKALGMGGVGVAVKTVLMDCFLTLRFWVQNQAQK